MNPRPRSDQTSPPTNGSIQTVDDAQLRTIEVTQDRFGQEFKHLMPLPHELFVTGEPVPVDLFLPRLRHEVEGDRLEAVCFLREGKILSEGQALALRQAGMDFYYAPRDKSDVIFGFMTEQVRYRLADETVPVAQKAHLIYENANRLMEQALATGNLEENISHGRAYVASLHQFLGGPADAPKSLASMMVLDSGLMSHSVNVCLLTTGFAAHLRMSSSEVQQLGLGALYHDVGMRAIPEDILKKPSALSKEEWQVIKRHPQDGHDLVAPSGALPPSSLEMILQHHENLDGTGYPNRLGGRDLGLPARLLRLVDAYDAITGARPFRQARYAFEAVRTIMDELRGKVDLDLLHDFVAFLGILAPEGGRPQNKRVHYTRGGRRIET